MTIVLSRTVVRDDRGVNKTKVRGLRDLNLVLISFLLT